jgi:hypothetical protein
MYTRRRRKRRRLLQVSPFLGAGYSKQQSPTRSHIEGLRAASSLDVLGSGPTGGSGVHSSVALDQEPVYAPHDWHVPTVNLNWHRSPQHQRDGTRRMAWAFPTHTHTQTGSDM